MAHLPRRQGIRMVGNGARNADCVKHLLIVAPEGAAVVDPGSVPGDARPAGEPPGVATGLFRSMTGRAKADGPSDPADSLCQADGNACRCSAGERLIWHSARSADGFKIQHYWSPKCRCCAIECWRQRSAERLRGVMPV